MTNPQTAKTVSPVVAFLVLFLSVSVLLPSAWAQSITRTSGFEYFAATHAHAGLLKKEIIEPGDSNLCVVTEYDYDAYGNMVSATTRNCNGSGYGFSGSTFSEAGAPTANSDPVIETRSSSTTYAAGSVTIDSTTYNYAAGRFPTTSTNALGHSETRTFDPRFGALFSLTGPNNLTTSWSYDSFGRQHVETRVDGTTTTWTFTACSCGGGVYEVKEQTTGAPDQYTYYDTLNRETLRKAQDFSGSTFANIQTTYDELGQVARKYLPYLSSAGAGAYTSFTYDALGRVLTVTEPDAGAGSLVTTNSYERMTVTVSQNTSTAQTRKTVRNSQGQVTLVHTNEGQSGGYVDTLVSYAYDAVGNLKTTTDAAGNVTALTYDTRGRKLTMADPDMGAWAYAYSVLGELKRQTDAKSQVTTMGYDKLGRMLSRTEPDLTSSWTYDTCTKGVGKLCSSTAGNNYSRTITYDSSYGRVSNIATGIDNTYDVGITYDSAGRVDEISYPQIGASFRFKVKQLYNASGYLEKVQRSDSGGSTIFWQATAMNAAGAVTNETLGNNGSGGIMNTVRSYDSLNRLTSTLSCLSTTTPCPGAQRHSQSYTYYKEGNVHTRADAIHAIEETLAYDNLNRLLSASATGLTSRSFEYNAIGNIIYKSDVGSYSYPASGSTSVRPHAVSSVAGALNASYSYDANGNMTSGNYNSISYKSFNLPASVYSFTANYVYTYNAEHERVKMVTQGMGWTKTNIYLHPDGGGSLFYEKETSGSGSVEHKHYIQAGDILVGAYSYYESGGSPGMRYFHRDNLGSIAAITNDSGGSVEGLGYEVYGERRYENGTAQNRNSPIIGMYSDRGFTGHEHLDEMNLIHMNGRIYDPALGRFMTADPNVSDPTDLQSFNRYSYVLNNPLAYVDPSGFDGEGGTYSGGFGTDYVPLPPCCIVVTPDPILPSNPFPPIGPCGFTACPDIPNQPPFVIPGTLTPVPKQPGRTSPSVPATTSLTQNFVNGTVNFLWNTTISTNLFSQWTQITVGDAFASDTATRLSPGLEFGAEMLILGVGPGKVRAGIELGAMGLKSAVGHIASSGGVVRQFEQVGDKVYYRVFSGEKIRGSWVTAVPPRSSAWAEQALALHPENKATMIQEVLVPNGTLMERSRALEMPKWGRSGGAEQFRIIDAIPEGNFGPGRPFR